MLWSGRGGLGEWNAKVASQSFPLRDLVIKRVLMRTTTDLPLQHFTSHSLLHLAFNFDIVLSNALATKR
jgi:hypothetical protein